MTLSKKNLDQLKSILKKENINKNNNSDKISTHKHCSISKDKSLKSAKPSEIFYSIIDNSEYLEDTTLSNKSLKESEDKLIKERTFYSINNQINSQRNNQLSEEDLLYDEFNYLLDE